MTWTVDMTARLVRACRRTYARKWTFFGVFAVIFVGSIFLLGVSGLLPDDQVVSVQSSMKTVAPIANQAIATTTPLVAVSENPVKIEIPTINLSAAIANPATTSVEVLDGYLLKGAVRYPTSAKLGESGNVVLFGHSSYLPIVGNQAYKTFDGIQKLVAGDTITVSSAITTYTYRVRSVAKMSAASDAGILLAATGRVLTLATCNSFGAKTDRFIVTADFVESQPISI